MKCGRVLLLAVSLFVVSCGENRGTPKPTSGGTPPGDDARNGKAGENMQLADGALWRADISWAREPKYSPDVNIVLSGGIFIRSKDGGIPKTVTDVNLVADMPTMGHGLGRNKPVVTPSGDGVGDYHFDKLVFSMEGPWRLRVTATVDGQVDVWTTTVNVEELK